MNTFLDYVAADLVGKFGTNLSNVVVVFPNKRARLFFSESLLKAARQTMWSPSYTSINELFTGNSDLVIADDITLVTRLYGVFCDVMRRNEGEEVSETIDHFYPWGLLMLGDFNDIDKNLVDPKQVFTNVANLHELDNLDYLSEESERIIRNFFKHFSIESSTELKRRFLKMWNNMADIYLDFNKSLLADGLAYEGALYRKVAETADLDFPYGHYAFVGFNFLQKVERRLFSRLDRMKKALFYWDHVEFKHIQQCIEEFPNQLDNHDKAIYGGMRQPKEITCIASPTETFQAQYVREWLNEGNRKADGRKTAVVMCDERILKSVLHCLPDGDEEPLKVNITTGYPLSLMPVSSFVDSLLKLQTRGKATDGMAFRLRYVNAVLGNSLFRHVSPSGTELYNTLNGRNKDFYPTPATLARDEGCRLLFQIIDGSSVAEYTKNMLRWLEDILNALATEVAASLTDETQSSKLKTQDQNPLFRESLFRMFTIVNRLSDICQTVELPMQTLCSLLTRIIRSTTIPFNGEPAEGIQIMGVLETRNLDFDHLLILSCNEGNMPKGGGDSSFLPFNIRKAFELPTPDNKMMTYAYYFYRMLLRSKDVTIMYNNSSEGVGAKEMSRFILQLLVESGHKLQMKQINCHPKTLEHSLGDCPNSDVIIGKIIEKLTPNAEDKNLNAKRQTLNAKEDKAMLSPSAINTYLKCPLQYYYKYVCNIHEADDTDEDKVDSRLFGNLFHDSAEELYRQMTANGDNRVTVERIDQWLKNAPAIERIVDTAFAKSRLTRVNGLHLISRQVIITFIRRLLSIDKDLAQVAPFEILGTEIDLMMPYTIGGKLTTTIGGRIDRLDLITDKDGQKRIRVVDYKTSKTNISKMKIGSVAEIFAEETSKEKHPDYYFQAMLYSIVVSKAYGFNESNGLLYANNQFQESTESVESVCKNDSIPVSPCLLFITDSEAADSTLTIGGVPINDIRVYEEEFMQLLHQKLSGLVAPEQPFAQTTNTARCDNCPYRMICGK